MYSEETHFNSKYSVSVVIPSLGGCCLYKTIESLNSGNFIPDEILISLPSKEHIDKIKIKENNVKLVNANCYGQVSQRVFGFKMAKHPYVLQLDDDVILGKECISLLIECVKNSDNIVASPYYLDFNSNPIHKARPATFFMKFFHLLMNGIKGFQTGKIAMSGINYGVNKADIKQQHGYFFVDWQPGGCLMHNNKNLIKENYFPFSGKAYSEDLIHSFLLKNNNLKLVTCLDAYCYIDKDIGFLCIKDIMNDFKARKYFVEMASLGKIRMYVFYWFVILKYIYFKARLLARPSSF
ncbi:MAG: glycosyltransferase [Pseudomonadota bacterium]|nr:glycosyltransferase [Pseudomonadota bacterium]